MSRLQSSSDLSGNALVATADTGNPDLATTFLRFMAAPEHMQSFPRAPGRAPGTRVAGMLSRQVRPSGRSAGRTRRHSSRGAARTDSARSTVTCSPSMPTSGGPARKAQ